MDSECSNISFRFCKRYEKKNFSEAEALQVLADLHGGGDKSNELVVLEYEQIRQQVRFSTTDKIFNGNTKLIPIRFLLIGLLRAH